MTAHKLAFSVYTLRDKHESQDVSQVTTRLESLLADLADTERKLCHEPDYVKRVQLLGECAYLRGAVAFEVSRVRSTHALVPARPGE